MIRVQFIGLVAALLSSGFWLAGAGIRLRPLSLFKFRGPESIPAVMQRQSLLNGFAAIFASVAAACQAFAFYQ